MQKPEERGLAFTWTDAFPAGFWKGPPSSALPGSPVQGTVNVQFCYRLGRTLAWPPAVGRAGGREKQTEKRPQSPAPIVGGDIWPLRKGLSPSLVVAIADQSPDPQGGQGVVIQGTNS